MLQARAPRGSLDGPRRVPTHHMGAQGNTSCPHCGGRVNATVGNDPRRWVRKLPSLFTRRNFANPRVGHLRRRVWKIRTVVAASPTYKWFNPFFTKRAIVPPPLVDHTCFTQAFGAYLHDKYKNSPEQFDTFFARYIDLANNYSNENGHFELHSIEKMLREAQKKYLFPVPLVLVWLGTPHRNGERELELDCYPLIGQSDGDENKVDFKIHILPFDDAGNVQNMHALAGHVDYHRAKNYVCRNQVAYDSVEQQILDNERMEEEKRILKQEAVKRLREQEQQEKEEKRRKAEIREGKKQAPKPYDEASSSPPPYNARPTEPNLPIQTGQNAHQRRDVPAPQPVRERHTQNYWHPLGGVQTQTVHTRTVEIQVDPPNRRRKEHLKELRRQLRTRSDHDLELWMHFVQAQPLSHLGRSLAACAQGEMRRRQNLRHHRHLRALAERRGHRFEDIHDDFDEILREWFDEEPAPEPDEEPDEFMDAQLPTLPDCDFSRGYEEGTDHYPRARYSRGKKGNLSAAAYFVKRLATIDCLEAVPLADFEPNVMLKDDLYPLSMTGTLLYSYLRSEPDFNTEDKNIDGSYDFRRATAVVKSGTRFVLDTHQHAYGDHTICVHSVIQVIPESSLDHVGNVLGAETPDHFVFAKNKPFQLEKEDLTACQMAELALRKSFAPSGIVPALGILSRHKHSQVKDGRGDNLTPQVVEAMARRAHLLAENNRKIVAGLPDEPVGTKQCQCCGLQQPLTKWRWKHRRCNDCQEKLNKYGAMTVTGRSVQQRLQVGPCYPGVVRLEGVIKRPKKSKWDRVDLTRGRLQYIDPNGLKHEVTDPTFKHYPDPKYEPQWETELVGIGIDGCYPMVSAKCATNQQKAVIGRMFSKPKHEPLESSYEVLERLDLCPNLDGEAWSHMEWYSSLPSGKKREMLRWINIYLTEHINKKYSQFSSFVKSEHLCGFNQESYPFWEEVDEFIDRLINAPCPGTHVVAGRHIKPKLKRLKKHWHSDATPYYGGNTPEQDHHFLQRLSQCESWFWTDFTSYDNSYTDLVWDYIERNAYSDVLDPDFWTVMKYWRKPQGKIGPFIFQAPTMNASGRDDTALANALINGLMQQICIAAAYNQVPVTAVTATLIHKMREDFVVGVCGDDMIAGTKVQLPLNFAKDLCDAYATFGFEAKYASSEVLEHAIFLGNRPVKTSSGWFWGRTIGRAAYKLGWVKLPCGDTQAINHGTHDQLLRTFPHVPVLADIARQVCELQKGKKLSVGQEDVHAPWKKQLTPGWYDSEALESTVKAYNNGFSVTELLDCIHHIQQVVRLPAIISHPVLDVMMAVDDM